MSTIQSKTKSCTNCGGKNHKCYQLTNFPPRVATLQPVHVRNVNWLAKYIINQKSTHVKVTGHTYTNTPTATPSDIAKKRALAVATALRAALERIKPGISKTITFKVKSRVAKNITVAAQQAALRKVTVCAKPVAGAMAGVNPVVKSKETEVMSHESPLAEIYREVFGETETSQFLQTV